MNDTLIQKIQSAQRAIQRAKTIYQNHPQDFLENYDAQDAAVLNLIRMAETAIDLANYLIKRDKLGIPASSAESFELLAQQGRISRALAVRLKAMVDFRNLAVHEYRKIDYQIVIRIIQSDVDEVLAFCDRIMELSLPPPMIRPVNCAARPRGRHRRAAVGLGLFFLGHGGEGVVHMGQFQAAQ